MSSHQTMINIEPPPPPSASGHPPIVCCLCVLFICTRGAPPLNPQSVYEEKARLESTLQRRRETARMAARGNPSGDSITEPSTDLRAMIEERDVGPMEEDPATLENGMNYSHYIPTYLPLARPPN